MITIQRNQITVKQGERIRNGIANQWYQHTEYFFGEKLLGRIQTRNRYFGKRIGSRVDVLSCVNDSCVIGGDLKWICGCNDLKLETE